MVPPDSHRISRARCYLGYNSGGARLSGTGLSPSTATPSRGLPLTTTLSHSPPVRQNQLSRPTTPTTQPLPGITCDRFSLIRFRSPLLTESLLFSLPVGTEMFHFPTFPPHALCVQARVTPHDWCGVPPFGHPRINARLAAPRGLTQPPTSFIGSWCPGIHRVPLTTCHTTNTAHPTPGRKQNVRPYKQTLQNRVRRCSRPLCSSQPTTRHPHTPPPTHTHPAPTGPMQAVRGQGSPDPTEEQRSPVPSGPNSVPTTHPRTRPRSTPTPEGTSSTRSPPREPAELVSVPPSSTTPHTRRPLQTSGRSRCGRGSGPHRLLTKGGRCGQCSLERR